MVDRVENQRSRFMDLYGLGNFTVMELQNKITPLDAQISNLKREISILERPLPQDEALNILSTWDDVVKNGDFDTKKALINALIEKIDLDGDDITIYWRFN